MALITCPECGKMISDQAVACPDCGYPLNQKKTCRHCGAQIDSRCTVCTQCGQPLDQSSPSGYQNPRFPNNEPIIINNSISTTPATPVQTAGRHGIPKDKWVSLLLCIFTICGHKFYEGKTGMGFLYIFTGGLFGIGWFVDIFSLLFKPNPYYV